MESSRAAEIIARARQALASVDRDELQADIERRELEDRTTIPTLPIHRRELLCKDQPSTPIRHGEPVFLRYETAAAIRAAGGNGDRRRMTDAWSEWVRSEIAATTRMLVQATGDAMLENNEWLIGKIMARVEAKEAAFERELKTLKGKIEKLRKELRGNDAKPKLLRPPNAA